MLFRSSLEGPDPYVVDEGDDGVELRLRDRGVPQQMIHLLGELTEAPGEGGIGVVLSPHRVGAYVWPSLPPAYSPLVIAGREVGLQTQAFGVFDERF